MKKNRFTPGPWEITPEGWYVVAGDVARHGVVVADLEPVGCGCGECVKRTPAPEQRSANARLIAAAPDLYDALKMIEWSGCVDGDETTGYCPCCEWAMPTHDPDCFVGNTLEKVEGDE